MGTELKRRDPDELLRAIQGEDDGYTRGGHLKVVLGYSAGVGKTMRLLDEARRRRERGQDVIVGAVQPEMPADADGILCHLECIPLLALGGGHVIDSAAIIARRPLVCMIDGLAYDNPPGAKNAHRWQDVEELVQSGIKVIASINVQYVAELQPQIEAITGQERHETVPLTFIESASEIEIVDSPPPDPATLQQPDGNARQRKLARLRELALLLAANAVDKQLNRYLERHGIHQHFGAQERILVYAIDGPTSQELIQHACRTARRFHGEVIVAEPKGAAQATARIAEAELDGAGDIHMERVALVEDDPGEEILDIARERGATQIFIARAPKRRFNLRGDAILNKIIREGRGMDIRIFPVCHG